ncbi:MAG: signal peptidase II [Synergistaceae bacterium]|nr:signal peptidase II [Synergistaceae bacterium]MBQ9628540.1 signal peptidase II [Synergistaceae bacterium]MBR0070429.1 signal peptidase II [Synergistaceae bacterium]MBR0250378.1 signal peptidase II [Synergistaceae bacterium]
MRSGIIIIICILLEHTARFFFAHTMSYNAGAAFGLFGSSPVFTLWLSGLACTFLLCILFFVNMKTSTRTGLAVMSGGALSNLIERIILGHVIDWIPVPFSFIDLNFNLADAEISLGALIAFISCLQ